jgi:hypothetical protein
MSSISSTPERDDIVKFFSFKDLTDTITELLKNNDIVWMGNVGLCTYHNCIRYILRLNVSTVQLQVISPIAQTFEWSYNHLISDASKTSPRCSYHVTLVKDLTNSNVVFSANLMFFKEFIKTLRNYLNTIGKFIAGESMYESWSYLDENDSVNSDGSEYSDSDSENDDGEDSERDSDKDSENDEDKDSENDEDKDSENDEDKDSENDEDKDSENDEDS